MTTPAFCCPFSSFSVTAKPKIPGTKFPTQILRKISSSQPSKPPFAVLLMFWLPKTTTSVSILLIPSGANANRILGLLILAVNKGST